MATTPSTATAPPSWPDPSIPPSSTSLPPLFADLLFALEHHDQGQTSPNPHIGTCWDADRLDLPRVGIVPSPKYFSTEEGKRLCRKLAGR